MTTTPTENSALAPNSPDPSSCAGSSTSSNLLRGTGIVGSLTLLSRVLGLIRDLLVARFLGAGIYTDAFFVAFRIPNLMRSLVAEGALTSAFVPVFSHELEHNPGQISGVFSSAAKFLTAITVCLSFIGVIAAPLIVTVLAPGFAKTPQQEALCIALTAIMSFYLVFVALVSLANGALNSLKIYGAAPLGQVVMNLALILGAIIAALYSEHTAVYILAWSVILGGIASLLVQMPLLKKAGLRVELDQPALSPTTKQMVRLMVPATAGAAVYQVSIFMNTVLASLLPIGSVSWLFYADRLAQLPIGLFTIALASVLLPALSKSSATNDNKEFSQSLLMSLTTTSFVMIPTSFGLYATADDLVSLLFQRGAFSAAAAAATAQAVKAMCLGLWAMSCSSMCMRAFIAKRDTITPTVFGVVNVVLGLTISIWLIGTPLPIENSIMYSLVSHCRLLLLTILPDYQLQHVGLALSTGASSLITLPLVIYLLLKRGVSLPLQTFVNHSGKCLICSSLMLFCIYQCSSLISTLAIRVLAEGIVGVVSYFVFTRLFGFEESRVLESVVRRRLKERYSNYKT